MTLRIQLPPDVEAKLRVRATASGEPIDRYVARLVQHFVATPTPLEEISGPIHQRFVESGTTEEQLVEELERAKHEMRAERRARQA